MRRPVIIVLAMLVPLLAACGEKRVELVSMADSPEVNVIYDILASNGVPDAVIEIERDSRESRARILVGREQLDAARRVLNDFNRPRVWRPGHTDLAPKGWGSLGSQLSGRERIRLARRQDLENSLLRSRRVREVSVHVSEDDPGMRGEDRGPRKNGVPPTELSSGAAVLLEWIRTESEREPPFTVEQLKEAVRGTFVGIEADRIKVTLLAYDVEERVLVPGPVASSAGTGGLPRILFIFTSVFGVACIGLTVLLLRSRRRQRNQLASTPQAPRAAA